MVIYVYLEFLQKKVCYNNEELNVTAEHLVNFISLQKGIPANELKVIYNKHYVNGNHVISNNATVHMLLSLPGGKGGFGSMLRAIGAQIEKTTNREACRDLSGRRLRDINEENRLKQWISKQAEREQEAADRKKARLERLRSLPKHDFHDPEYNRLRSDLPERIDDALTEGLKKSSANGKGLKRKIPQQENSSKKASKWFDELEEITSEEGESSTSEDEDPDLPHSSSVTTPDKTNEQGDSTLVQRSKKSATKQKQETVTPEVLDLMAFEYISEVEALGLNRLKSALVALGMKCGGTLQQRAERLWAVRGIEPKKIDATLLAKPVPSS